MRLTLRAVLVVASCALVAAAPAAAGNGGVAPVAPKSPNAEGITEAYWLVLGITGAVFLLVEGALIFFIVRFRRKRRARTAEGPQIRGNTNLEIAWTVVPVLLLAAIAGFVFAQLPGIQDVPEARAGDRLEIRVEGHQYYWEFRYPDGQISIDTMVVPAERVVRLTVVSPDVIHSWWIPALGGKIDAIPGRTNHTWFQASKVGVYRGQCAELCGLLHAEMLASVEVVSEAQFRAFLAAHRPGSRTVGREEFEGVCAKCHGLQGEGGIGPPLADREFTVAELTPLLRQGRGAMPAVGSDWSEAQIVAVTRYLQRELGGEGAQGGG